MRGMQWLFLLGFLLFSTQTGFSQVDTLWSARIGSDTDIELHSIVSLANSEIAVCGLKRDSTGSSDFFAARLTTSGNVLWTRSYGSPTISEVGNSIIELSNGTLVLAGYNSVSSPSSGTGVKLLGLSAQGDSLWAKSYRLSSITKGYGACALADGNAAVVGYTGRTGQSSDLWLLKINPQGDTLWTHTYGGSGADYGYRVAPASNGDLIIGGCNTSRGANTNGDAWLLRTNYQGNTLIDSVYGFRTTTGDTCFALSVKDGSVYLAGASDQAQYIVRTATNGAIQLVDTVDNPGPLSESIHGIAVVTGSEVFCVGWDFDPGTSAYYPMIGTINAVGTGENQKRYSTNGRLWDCIALNGGGFLAVGSVTEGILTKGLLMRFRSLTGITGTVLNLLNQAVPNVPVSMIGRTNRTVTNAVGQFTMLLPAGTYGFIVGGTCVTADTTLGVRVARDTLAAVDFHVQQPISRITATSVNVAVHNRIPGAAPLTINNVGNGAMAVSLTVERQQPNTHWLTVQPSTATVQPGDSLIAWITSSPDTTDTGTFDYSGSVLVRTNVCPDSLTHIPVLIWVLDAEDHPPSTPQQFALNPAYPNPFNPVTTLSFDVPQRAPVRITVYDLMGREVATLVHDVMDAGKHTVDFNASALPSGMYLVRMQSGSFAQMQKVLLLN